ASRGGPLSSAWLDESVHLTDANGAIFDARHAFAGCIPGIHEVLRRQGLLVGTWCLDPNECLSPGQAEEITRVSAAYPGLTDDAFVAEHLDAWLA
ncbi:MAG: dihydrodipicolinate synthase family protein, partial [Polaromonas sp.]|nr:dihydrodipicolinate synthase family protein [Gemmatimonadaceae bacterium]